MELNSIVREFILSNLNVFEQGVELGDSDNIYELGFVNSLFAMKLLNFIENKFGIVVENDQIDIANFSSVNSIVNLVKKSKLE